MKQSETKNQKQALWVLLSLASLVGAAAALWTTFVVNTDPEGYHARVLAGFSPDGKRAFWHVSEKLHVTDLDTLKQSAPMDFRAYQIEWSLTKEDTLYYIEYDGDFHLAWITWEDRRIEEGPPAYRFSQAVRTGEVFLFNKQEDAVTAQAYRIGEGPAVGPALTFFDQAIERGSYFAGVGVSPDGKFIAAGIRNPLMVEIRRRDGGEVLLSGGKSSFFFFDQEKRRLVSVQTRDIVIHDDDLETGTRSQSSEKIDGRFAAAETTPDLGRLAIGLRRGSSRKSFIELFETDPIRNMTGTELPGERSVLALHFEDDGNSLLAIGRSGLLWRWVPSTGTLEKLGRVAGGQDDKRWLWAIAGLVAFGLLWVGIIRLRWASSFRVLSPAEKKMSVSRSTSGNLLLTACTFEIFKLAATVMHPEGVLSVPNVIFIFGHLVLGVAGVLLMASMAILRIPARWELLSSTIVVLAVGAALDFFIFYLFAQVSV